MTVNQDLIIFTRVVQRGNGSDCRLYDGSFRCICMARMFCSFVRVNIIFLFYRSKRLQSRILQSCLLNGGIFLGSVVIFETGIKLLSTNDGWLMRFLYQYLLVYPIFIVSLVISNRIDRDVGHDASLIFLGSIRKDGRSSGSQSLFSSFAVQGYYWMLLGVLIVQAKLLSLFPVIGPMLSFLFFSIVSAWYSFEYAWNSLHYTLEKKVQLLEENWVFFIGFGTPLTLMTFFSPFTLNQGIFALLFPFV